MAKWEWSERLPLIEAQRSQQHQRRTELCSVISQVSEPHVGSRGAQSNRIGRSTRHATCIKPQDYDRKTQPGCGPVQRAQRAGRRPGPCAAQLGSAQAACKQASTMPRGAKVWRQRRLQSELSASPPSCSPSVSSSLPPSRFSAHFQNPTQALRASWASCQNPDSFTSFPVEGARMSSCHDGKCKLFVFRRPGSATVSMATGWFPLCRHTFRLPYSRSIISARFGRSSFKNELWLWQPLRRQAGRRNGKQNNSWKKYSTIWWRPLLSHLSE